MATTKKPAGAASTAAGRNGTGAPSRADAGNGATGSGDGVTGSSVGATGPGVSKLAASVGLTDEDLLGMYRTIALARAVDERMWILNRAGRIPFVISGQGHEGAQVGIAWALEKGLDWIAPFYRSVGTLLTFGMGARDIMTAQFAKAVDVSSGGRQMPGHYGSRPKHLVSLSSPVATQMLHAVGIALAAKIRKTGEVAMSSMGEGSANQGDVHEGLNFAGIHKLPFILVVENNGYAISVPVAKQLPIENVADRAAGYGMPGVVVDGSDVLACYRAGKAAVDRARRGDGSTFIEAKVIRLTGHSSDDQQSKYRSAEELAEMTEKDPLPRFREQLRKAGVLTDELEARIADEVRAEVEDATTYAEEAPDPDPATAMQWVFAEDWPGETPPAWGFRLRGSAGDAGPGAGSGPAGSQ